MLTAFRSLMYLNQKKPQTLLSFNLGWLRQKLLGISSLEATVTKRGFNVNDLQIKHRLEQIGCTFLHGYHKAISSNNLSVLQAQLNQVEKELQGFAFEGAGMGLALLDNLTPWKQNRLQGFLDGAGNDHIYMMYVGMGWALARLPWALKPYLKQLKSSRDVVGNVSTRRLKPDPLLGWLALDGYGFHQGYFYWRDYIQGIAIPQELSGYALRVFDQGLGRSIWFVEGSDVTRIPQTIQNFHPERRGDLWSGVGLAATYAGGVERSQLEALKMAAGVYLPQIAQGAAFAAKTRIRAGNATPHTEMACQVFCEMSLDEAAQITDNALEGLSAQGDIPAYEIWRQRIQAQFKP